MIQAIKQFEMTGAWMIVDMPFSAWIHDGYEIDLFSFLFNTKIVHSLFDIA